MCLMYMFSTRKGTRLREEEDVEFVVESSGKWQDSSARSTYYVDVNRSLASSLYLMMGWALKNESGYHEDNIYR